MKKKLNRMFLLITMALIAIAGLQIYWTVNAYNVNKTNFDSNVDVAMQNAMDDCKKDYFDSIRIVLVKRLSDTAIKIRIDTLHEADTVHKQLSVYIKSKHSALSQPFHITSNQMDYYRAMIKHKATIPEVLTEASFYIPSLMNDWEILLGMDDIEDHWTETAIYLKAHSNIPRDTIFAKRMTKQYGIYAMPVNYRQADSLKLTRYFRSELLKKHITSNYHLYFSLNHTLAHQFNAHYSETGEYSYKYHGFVFLNMVGDEFFARAVFTNPQYVVLRNMLIPLLLAIFLIAFTIYCFNYIIRLVVHQKKLAELKDDFINNMTHELKTPIATISVAIEGLQNFNALNDKEKTQRYLQTSKTELSKLNNLVSKILNIAAFENKDVELIKEEVNIDELLTEIISSYKVKIEKKVDFSYVNRDGLQSIYVDKLHFTNVLNNLIDNAIKYSNEPVKIAISCLKNHNHAEFVIADNGIGVPEAHIGQIFDKFHRVPAGNVHNVKGTGLGLSYAKYIVEAHGGSITVKSEINKGSEFTVSIPLKNE